MAHFHLFQHSPRKFQNEWTKLWDLMAPVGKGQQWPLNLFIYLLIFELLGFVFTSFALVIRAEKSFRERTLPCSSTAPVIVTYRHTPWEPWANNRTWQTFSFTIHLFYSHNITFSTSYNVANSGLNACKVRRRTDLGFVSEIILWNLWSTEFPNKEGKKYQQMTSQCNWNIILSM